MKAIFKIGLFALITIFVVFSGCRKSPSGSSDGGISEVELVPPGTYPSFDEYLSTQNVSSNFADNYIYEV